VPIKFSVAYEGNLPPEMLLGLAQAADRAGVNTLWAASHLFQREPIVNASMVLANTTNLTAALMAMSPYTMHPVHIAMAAAALDEWFPGRVTLSFGVGAPRDLAAVGLNAGKPLQAISESIAIARALLAGEVVRFDGQRFRVTNQGLSSGERSVPIILAASGPKMLELAGAEADGVLISAAASPAFIKWALRHVAVGEAKGGRRVHKAALVYSSVADDGRGARDQLRHSLAFVLRGGHHKRNLDMAGTQMDQAALARAFADENWATVEKLVDDTVFDNHSASGTPEQVRRAFSAYQSAGLDEIVLAGVTTGTDLPRLLRAASPTSD
jgi:5,10-methylenetetrahydromethanopterin reductase